MLAPAMLPAKSGTKDLSDGAVEDMVRRKLANDRDIKGGTLQVTVKEGVVTVSGAVENDRYRQKAEKIVRKAPGVKQVVNQITVRPVR